MKINKFENPKSAQVNGCELNERFSLEIMANLEEGFAGDEIYTVSSDGCIQDEKGHECAYDFIPEEDSLYGIEGSEWK